MSGFYTCTGELVPTIIKKFNSQLKKTRKTRKDYFLLVWKEKETKWMIKLFSTSSEFYFYEFSNQNLYKFQLLFYEMTLYSFMSNDSFYFIIVFITTEILFIDDSVN